MGFCMRESGVAVKHVRLMQYKYESSMTVLKCIIGVMDGFKVEEGLHQCSALRPILVSMVMD